MSKEEFLGVAISFIMGILAGAFFVIIGRVF
jgi:uncharacterized membrane protein YjjP (DUF1212 family)